MVTVVIALGPASRGNAGGTTPDWSLGDVSLLQTSKLHKSIVLLIQWTIMLAMILQFLVSVVTSYNNESSNS